MKAKPAVSVIGGSGYAAAELVKILSEHELVKLKHVFSHTKRGKLSTLQQSLKKDVELTAKKPKEVFQESNVVFFATPIETSLELIPKALDAGCKVIDLSPAFRLPDEKQFFEAHGFKHPCPELLNESAYGLTELNKSAIRKSKLIANAGCYATSVLLALAPLAGKLVKLIADCKSGSSGAGANPKHINVHHSEIHGNVVPYNILAHNHSFEIAEKSGCEVYFVPHVIPISRGISSTIYFELTEPLEAEDVKEAHAKFYCSQPFVQTLSAVPKITAVLGTNDCKIGGFAAKKNVAVAISCIDNLIKGAAGQAVQNMNVMLGFEETKGLEMHGLFL